MTTYEQARQNALRAYYEFKRLNKEEVSKCFIAAWDVETDDKCPTPFSEAFPGINIPNLKKGETLEDRWPHVFIAKPEDPNYMVDSQSMRRSGLKSWISSRDYVLAEMRLTGVQMPNARKC